MRRSSYIRQCTGPNHICDFLTSFYSHLKFFCELKGHTDDQFDLYLTRDLTVSHVFS